MKTLAIIGIVLIMGLVIGLQHLFNWFLRKDLDKSPLPILGALGIVVSIAITFALLKNYMCI
jgi:hypothetical protein